MTRTKEAAVGMLAAVVLLSDSGSAQAAVHRARVSGWHRFENALTDHFLAAVGNDGALRAEQPNRTGDQDFYLWPGRRGFQMESRSYPRRCVTAADTQREVHLEKCRPNDTAQLWDYHPSGDESAIASVGYPYVCIGEDDHTTIVLVLCGDALDQRWHPVS